MNFYHNDICVVKHHTRILVLSRPTGAGVSRMSMGFVLVQYRLSCIVRTELRTDVEQEQYYYAPLFPLRSLVVVFLLSLPVNLLLPKQVKKCANTKRET